MTPLPPAQPFRAVVARVAAVSFSVGALVTMMLQASGASGCRHASDGTVDPAPPALTDPAPSGSAPIAATTETPSTPVKRAATAPPPEPTYYFPATKAAPMRLPEQRPSPSPGAGQ